MKNTNPPEVHAYFDDGSRDVCDVRVENPYFIVVRYDDGKIRRIDMSGELVGVMEALKDPSVFATAHHKKGRCIVWDTPYGEIDIDKDALYIYGEKI